MGSTNSFVDFSENMEFCAVVKNEYITLPLSDEVDFVKPNMKLKEDEEVYFILTIKWDIKNLILYLQDMPILSPIKTKNESGYVYTWRNNSNNSFFLNHFGYCQITIEMTIEERRIFKFCIVQVLATKINAKNTEKILSYLESKLDNIVQTCFSMMHHKSSGKKSTINHPSFTLQQIKRILFTIEQLLPQFRLRPFTRVREEQKVTPYSLLSNIDEATINRIADGSTEMQPARIGMQGVVKIRNKSYQLEHLVIDALINETDIYENQVIHGFLNHMHLFIVDISRDLDPV